MDNKLLSINGKGRELLQKALEVAMFQEWDKYSPVTGWAVDPEYGMILYSYSNSDKIIKLPFECETPDELTTMVWGWLKQQDVSEYKHGDWEEYCDMDGSISEGWHVYVNDWGRVGDDYGVLCAVKPVYLWYGK